MSVSWIDDAGVKRWGAEVPETYRRDESVTADPELTVDDEVEIDAEPIEAPKVVTRAEGRKRRS